MAENKEKARPFEMRVPNRLTANTLEKSERGEDVHHAKDAHDLFKQLGMASRQPACGFKAGLNGL